MTKRVTIPLKIPLRAPDGEVKQIVLREPDVYMCLELGDPFVVGSSENGTNLVVENPEVITAYVMRCLVEPADPATLKQGGVEVARAIKEAIIGFFLPDTATDAVSATSPTSSPSAASAEASPTLAA